MKKPDNVDEYIYQHENWHTELTLLREIMLSTGLEEGIKWLFPVYMWKGKNIVGLAAFKEYCGIWFFQGATLTDELGVLTNAQEGKTQAMRQWRFTELNDINHEKILAYVEEAIENQKSGNVIKASRKVKPLVIPPELQEALDNNTTLATHFKAFSKGNQRDFADYIANAKRKDTKERRLQKILPMILENVGLNDKYKKK